MRQLTLARKSRTWSGASRLEPGPDHGFHLRRQRTRLVL